MAYTRVCAGPGKADTGLYPILIMSVILIPFLVCVALLEGGDVNSMKQTSLP